jgi:hypothetical protein
MSSWLRVALLLSLGAMLGCGNISFPYSSQIAIIPSPLIATGAWTINGESSAGATAYPIGGFLGALTIEGSTVKAGFTIASSDAASAIGPASCLGPAGGDGSPFGVVGLVATGTVVDGTLTLDSDFANSHLHLVAQLSLDGESLASGSYTVTGACATSSPGLDGHWNAPLTGTYTGQLNSISGDDPHVTATLSQSSYYWGYGYIPVNGSILFDVAGCTTSVQLQGGYLIGDLNLLGGYTSSATVIDGVAANNVLVSGLDDPLSQTISSIDWSYPDSGCGAETGSPGNSGVLVRH